jgi:tRNA-modifying protein YgfZ
MEQLKICRLPDWGLILIEGQDASAFLQGQLTNSVLGLTITPSGVIAQSNSGVRFTGYCSAKGRLLASGWICLSEHQETSRYAFFVSRDLAAIFAKRLSMFVLRSKVTVNDVSDRWHVYGALGSIPNLSPHLPKDAIALTMRHPTGQGNTERIVFASEQDIAIANDQSLSLWDSAEVASAIPRIIHPTQDQFVPQMINLESVGGVDFKKGCYPGQEVVARSQYRGVIKRRLYLARVQSSMNACAPATEIIHESDPEQPAGMIVLSAINPQSPDWVDLQIECKTDLAQSGKLHLRKSDGPPLQLGNLPYSLIEI